MEEPYQRTNCDFFNGVAGWQDEFEVIRIRLTDFQEAMPAFLMDDLSRLRFDFGATYGSDQGRIVIDDIRLSSD